MTQVQTENKVEGFRSECPHCGASTVNRHFCEGCERIQPVVEGTDYFAFFGLERRLQIDTSDLEKTFYALSRRFHPDYFMSSTESEQVASVQRSSMLNDAYRTLKDPVSRATYLLSLEGYKEAEKKAPPELLEEVFELNMQIEELKAAKAHGDKEGVSEAVTALEEALKGLKDKLREIDQTIENLAAKHDRADSDSLRKQALDQLSQTLSHRSYLQNLVGEVKEEI